MKTTSKFAIAALIPLISAIIFITSSLMPSPSKPLTIKGGKLPYTAAVKRQGRKNMANPILTPGTAGTIFADASTRFPTSSLSSNTIAICNAAGVLLASASIQSNGSQTITFSDGGSQVTGTFSLGSSSAGASSLSLKLAASGYSGITNYFVAVNTYQSGAVTNSYSFDTASAAPVAPTAPTTGGTTPGATSISVNTQALTANATSENLQVSTDSTFATGVTNVSVPSPGTAVTVNSLTSGTIYYLRLQMIGSGGTASGPSTALKFDTTGPTFPAGSAVINSAGTTLTVTAAEFSPPLTVQNASGLTLSLSGGAATLSGVTAAGSVITGTLSRTVASGETGTLAIAAGAIGDSASPTANSNASVPAYAVTNNSTYVPPIPPPTAPAAPAVSGVTAYGAALTIPALSTGATSYNLQYAPDAAGSPGSFNTIATGVAPSSSVAVSGLAPLSSGYFRLVAVNAGGQTAGTSTGKVTTLLGTERGTVFQGLQWGVETMPGVIVPATKRILSLQTDPEPIIPISTYRPYGNKSYTETQSGQEMTEANFSGILDFMTMPYLLSAHMGNAPAAPATLAGGAYQWDFALNETQPATPTTLSCEVGGAQGASRFGYGFIPDLEMTLAKEEASISGKLMGQLLGDNITLTASCPELPATAMPPKLARISLGTSAASLTKLTRVISAKVTMNDHFAPQFFRDDGQASFSGIVEKAPNYMWQVVNELGSDTDTLLAGLRNDTLFYLQLMVTGNLIGAGVYNLFYITMPVKVQKQPTREDHDGVYGGTYDFIGAHDPVFGAAQARVICKLPSL